MKKLFLLVTVALLGAASVNAQKYNMVVTPKGGAPVTFAAEGVSVKFEEVPVEVALAAGDDLAAKFAEAVEANPGAGSFELKIPAGATVNLASALQTNAKVRVYSDAANPGTLKATAGFLVGNSLAIEDVKVDASGLADPLIGLNTETEGIAGLNGTDYLGIEAITIKNAEITDVKNSLVYDNNKKYAVVALTIENSVIKLALEAVQNESVIAFQQGGVKDFTVKNSTIYGTGEVAKYFIRYNNSARLDRYGYDKNSETQKMTYLNNTFYKVIKSDGQWGNYNGVAGQAYSAFDVQDNIWVDSSKDIIRRLSGGRFGSGAPLTFSHNTYYQDGEDLSSSEASYDNSGNILTTDPGFKNAAAGDFTISGSQQLANETGDPRWIPAPKSLVSAFNAALLTATSSTVLQVILEDGAVYSLDEALVLPVGKTVYIGTATNENPAIIKLGENGQFVASGSFYLLNVTVNAAASNQPLIALNPNTTGIAALNSTDYLGIDQIQINQVTINGLKGSLIWDSNKKYCVVRLTIAQSLIELATDGVSALKNQAIIAFQQGGVKDFWAVNNTIYQTGDDGNGYFIRYNNSARLDRYGYDKDVETQSINFGFNTFYNVVKGGQWGNYGGIAGQAYSAFQLVANIWQDCGSGQITRRILGGRAASSYKAENLSIAYNTYWFDGEAETEGTIGVNDAGEPVNVGSYDTSGTALTSDPNFVDAANADFTPQGEQQLLVGAGDPRWLPAAAAPAQVASKFHIAK
ncbi:MAG: DUF4957 domain-containing protein [Prevotella sp.]|nr:DUF4957 domain-containing protein [Prevotella sp.]